MRGNVVGTITAVIVLFISLIVLPTYFKGIIDWRNDMNTCQTAARNFVDMVIDNGQVTDRALSDLNLSLASCTTTFTYTYYREEKVVNPSSTGSGVEVSWSFVEVNEDTVWNTGDICTIVIKQGGLNVFQRISFALLGTSYNKQEIRLSGMVR